uniref:Putative lipocalin-3 1 n=1 Tax=Amblyomma triste TaxID=251400 RepID=A0A023G6T2_AMBTT
MWSFAAIVIALLATATLSSGEAAVEQTTTVYRDIKAFLNTTGPILSFSLSTKAVSLCKLDYNIEITNSGTTFNRYLPGTTRTSAIAVKRNPKIVVNVTGEFYNAQIGETYDAMRTRYSDGSTFTEAIDYESSDSVCAIFSVAARSQRSPKQKLAQPQVTRELRIKLNSQNIQEAEQCFQSFKNILDESKKAEISSSLTRPAECLQKLQEFASN